MKHLFTLLSVLLIGFYASAQSSKQVKWAFSAKKLSDKVFEVHCVANINPGWHLYAQQVGVEGPLPTTFEFNRNPLYTIDGGVKESGKRISKKEKAWDGVVNYYEKTVEFVQVIKLKGGVKTSVNGKVQFMVCNDHQCLTPSDTDFSIKVGE